MFGKLLGLFGAGPKAASPPAARTVAHDAGPPPAPYPQGSAANDIYQLLFCDDPAPFQPKPGAEPTDWQATLFGSPPDASRIAALAADAAAESRVRVLAWNWLRTHGHPTPKGEVLGVVLEAPLGGGLDVLAAYGDGAVRYINQSGKLVLIEPGGLADANGQAQQVVALARPLVAQIGPWDRARLPAPRAPNVRVSFLVSDGLYFGEGPFEALQKDPLAGPLIAQATTLLVTVTQAGIGASGGQGSPNE